MTRLLGVIILVLALVFFPPAALAVVSNNAVPGDSTYPIKRGLEDVIYAVASLNPNTKALFAKARSDRRFQEITVLLSQGKEAGQTLNELVEQTRNAANQIDQVSDSSQKQKLLRQLSDSITKYDQGLLQISQNKIAPAPSKQPALTPSPILQTPLPSVSPAPAPSLTPDPELERIRRELEEIKRRLEEERQRQMQQQNQPNQNPTPIPNTPSPTQIATSTPTPRLTPTPSPTPKGKKMQAPKKGNKDFEYSNQAGKQSGTSSPWLEQEE